VAKSTCLRVLTLRMRRARVPPPPPPPPPPPAGDSAELPSIVRLPSCILLQRPLADVISLFRAVTSTCYASRVEHLSSRGRDRDDSAPAAAAAKCRCGAGEASWPAAFISAYYSRRSPRGHGRRPGGSRGQTLSSVDRRENYVSRIGSRPIAAI